MADTSCRRKIDNEGIQLGVKVLSEKPGHDYNLQNSVVVGKIGPYMLSRKNRLIISLVTH
jgi:hypothetical protein